MTIWRMRIAPWIPKATDTQSSYVIPIAFPLRQWLHQGVSVLRCTYSACLVISVSAYNTVSVFLKVRSLPSAFTFNCSFCHFHKG
jgi:hypothetical protein